MPVTCLTSANTRRGAVYETLGGEDDLSCGLALALVTTAALSPPPVNGWYRNPTFTLDATDHDFDVDHSEYRVDGGPWSTYPGPFLVTEDGQHVIEYRSVDKVGDVEASRTLAFASDATPPTFQGMPAAPCTIWPPTNKLVKVAAVTSSDAGSGVAPGSLSVDVVSNEPVTAADILVVETTVLVRASRLGGSNGRIYTLTAHASVLAGNVASATATCTVPHDRSNQGDVK